MNAFPPLSSPSRRYQRSSRGPELKLKLKLKRTLITVGTATLTSGWSASILFSISLGEDGQIAVTMVTTTSHTDHKLPPPSPPRRAAVSWSFSERLRSRELDMRLWMKGVSSEPPDGFSCAGGSTLGGSELSTCFLSKCKCLVIEGPSRRSVPPLLVRRAPRAVWSSGQQAEGSVVLR